MKLVAGRWCVKCQRLLVNVDWKDHERQHREQERAR